MPHAEPTGHVAPDLFRHVMARFASGVTVVTVDCEGERAGFTASSFTSGSLDPPLVLVCAARRLDALALIERCGRFAVSILGVGQRDLGLRFAGLLPGVTDRFEGVALLGRRSGSPWIAGSLAWLECRVWRLYDGGDHVIVVGEVIEAALGEAGDPLGYYDRHWQRLTRLDVVRAVPSPVKALTDLATMLRELSPRLEDGEVVYVAADGPLPSGLAPIAVFHEREGASAIVAREAAERARLVFQGAFRQLTLDVESDLQAVGLIAAVAQVLASAGIACNIVSALRHDHLFVPAADAERALALLEALRDSARLRSSDTAAPPRA